MRVIALAFACLSLLAPPDVAFARQRRPLPPERQLEARRPTQKDIDESVRKANRLHVAAEAYLAGDSGTALRGFATPTHTAFRRA